MLKAILFRLGGAVPVLILVTCGIFALIHLAPGDAATLLAPDEAGPAEVARLRAMWGLDQPLLVQLWRFLVNAAQLNFGTSLRYQQPVMALIAERLPATLELALVTLMIAVAIGVPLGVMAALNKGGVIDGVVSFVAIGGVSAPSFWMGILLVLLFSAELHLLPSGSRLPYGTPLSDGTGFFILDSILQGRLDTLRLVAMHLLLPSMTLALGMIGIISRITRSAVVDVGQEDFIFTAVAKGLTRGAIVRQHLLPNAAIPISTIIGLELGVLISGTIIVEVVFSWPGVGTLLYQAVTVRDTPLTTGVVIVYTMLFIALNVLIDLFYFIVDPRVRAAGGMKR
jgi:ABC-type dipeptide/oligopeptide/nickel transport system permease component